MRLLKEVTLDEIEDLLLQLGSGNHEDNMGVLREYSNYYLVELFEQEFFKLVFLQNGHVLPICPRNQDRSLRAVADRALLADNPELHPNWNLAKVKSRTRQELKNSVLRELVLRPARPNEKPFGPWYLQDGSHTALGYAMLILSSEVSYAPVRAYVASNEPL